MRIRSRCNYRSSAHSLASWTSVVTHRNCPTIFEKNLISAENYFSGGENFQCTPTSIRNGKIEAIFKMSKINQKNCNMKVASHFGRQACVKPQYFKWNAHSEI